MPKVDIATQGYDLSFNRYQEVVHEEVEHLAPKDILANLAPVRGGNSAGDGEIGGDVGIIVFANLIIDCC